RAGDGLEGPAAGLIDAGWLGRGDRQKRGGAGDQHRGDPARHAQRGAVGDQVGGGQDSQAKGGEPGHEADAARAGTPRNKGVTNRRFGTWPASTERSHAGSTPSGSTVAERGPAIARSWRNGVRRV